jgi:hypothetical protein
MSLYDVPSNSNALPMMPKMLASIASLTGGVGTLSPRGALEATSNDVSDGALRVAWCSRRREDSSDGDS